jgi:hypothetical protein
MTDCPPRNTGNEIRLSLPLSWWFGLVGLVALGFVWWQPPVGQLFYPQCLLHATTGWQCPGCGATRATHALLHGRWGEAWSLNALWLVTLPLFVWTYAAWLVNETWQRTWFQPLNTRWGILALFAVLAAFGVGRNVPWTSWLGH